MICAFCNFISAIYKMQVIELWYNSQCAWRQTPTIPGYPVINNRGTFYYFYKKGQIQQKNMHCPYKTVLMKGVVCLPLFSREPCFTNARKNRCVKYCNISGNEKKVARSVAEILPETSFLATFLGNVSGNVFRKFFATL